MVEGKKYAVFIDLDKTLLSVNSGKALVWLAYKDGLLPLKSLLNAIYTSIVYKLSIKNPSLVVLDMVKWLNGLSENDIINTSNKVINSYLLEKIRPSIVKQIEYHKKLGGDVVLLSASLQYICKPIAKFVGINNVICSYMEVKNGVFTGKPEGEICIGLEKRKKAEEYCKQNSYNISEAFSFGDSITDRYIMESVGNQICVKPDKELQKLANEKNWRII